MTDQPAPDAVVRLLADRAEARLERDWSRADALRDEIRRLGWEPVDSATGSSARPILTEGAGSRLDAAASLDASLVTVVEDHPDDAARLVAALRRHTPMASWELVLVANGVDADRLPAVDGLPVEVATSAPRLGWADAVNLGLREARGAVVVLLDGSVEPSGAFLPPLLAAFDDPAVGVAGPWGVVSDDARQFEEAEPGPVDAVLGYCMAFRREALQQVRGFDPYFRFYRNADLDLSFAVRDAGWRAVSTGPLPLERQAHRGWTSLTDAERDRLSRRNFYRFLKHWGQRPDLLIRPRDP